MNNATSYPLSNADARAARHHGLLSVLFDEFCLNRAVRLMELRGKRCLDVGAGNAQFALTLARHVGEGGYVLATDKDPRPVARHPQLSVMADDLTGARWSLGEGWDLIHARLTLLHLPQRREILHRLVGALASGGVILVEDWDASNTHMVLSAPDLESAALYTRFQEVLGGRVFAAAGTDRGWARQVHAAMLTEGLVEVDTVVHGQSWTGGGPGCELIAGTLEQVRPALLAGGLSEDELARVLELLDDPRLVVAGHPLYSTSGRAPGTDDGN